MSDKPSLVRRTPWPASATRPVATPLQPSAVYAARDPDMLDDHYEGRIKGYAYAREAHPNADILAQKIDQMEGVSGGTMTSSGMSAVLASLMSHLKPGDHVVAADQLYGQTLKLLTNDLPRLGISYTLADPTNADAVAQAITPKTRAIMAEVVSNPTIRVADMRGISDIAHQNNLLLIVDNTFTTPYGFQPFDMGADIVVHSVTKLLAGHSDATLGYVVAKDRDLNEEIKRLAITWGLNASPYDCWMAERGLYSFDLRYERAQTNAATLADHLSTQTGVRRVLYPTRADHPDHNRAVDLLNGHGGHMVSFEIDGGRAEANALVRAMPNIAFAPTLGDIGTTLSHPPSSSHRRLSAEVRAKLGISEGFFRVSVGIEDPDLLCHEFGAALQRCFG